MKTVPTGVVLCAVLSAIFATSSLFAQTTWTTNGVLSGKHALSASLAMYSAPLIEEGRSPLSALYRFEVPRVSAMGAFQFSEDTQDIVLNGVYFPLVIPHVRLGAGAVYHGGWFEMDGDLISFQNDIFLGAYATITFWRMYLNVHTGWFEQIVTIPALPPGYETFAQSDMSLSLFIGGKPLDNFSAELGVASYELYRYHLFFNPVFSLALRYEFQTPRFQGKALEGRIFVELSISTRYSDMFTLSGHVAYSAKTLTVGYTL